MEIYETGLLERVTNMSFMSKNKANVDNSDDDMPKWAKSLQKNLSEALDTLDTIREEMEELRINFDKAQKQTVSNDKIEMEGLKIRLEASNKFMQDLVLHLISKPIVAAAPIRHGLELAQPVAEKTALEKYLEKKAKDAPPKTTLNGRLP